MDFSRVSVPPDFFEDDIRQERSLVSESILRRVYEAANEFDANTISKDLHLLPKDMMVSGWT